MVGVSVRRDSAAGLPCAGGPVKPQRLDNLRYTQGMWRFFRSGDLPPLAEAYRRVHEAWLTRAVRSGRTYPRIPLKRVDQGGFDGMVKTPRGRAMADRWWMTALERVDD
jgi:hypothetical protein